MKRHALRNGQSLIEVLLGLGLGAVFMIAAASVIAPALRTNTQVTQVQARSQIANELVENVESWASGNWNGVLALATGTANTYYLNTATSSFSVATGTQAVIFNSSTYGRYFYLSDVYRDSNGNVTSTTTGNNYDPSTKLVTIIVAASSSLTSSAGTTTVIAYITRNANNVENQTSWVGGAGQTTPVTLVGTSYATSNNVSVNATGSFQLAAPSAGSCTL
jgi:hypothetical protein